MFSWCPVHVRLGRIASKPSGDLPTGMGRPTLWRPALSPLHLPAPAGRHDRLVERDVERGAAEQTLPLAAGSTRRRLFNGSNHSLLAQLRQHQSIATVSPIFRDGGRQLAVGQISRGFARAVAASAHLTKHSALRPESEQRHYGDFSSRLAAVLEARHPAPPAAPHAITGIAPAARRAAIHLPCHITSKKKAGSTNRPLSQTNKDQPLTPCGCPAAPRRR